MTVGRHRPPAIEPAGPTALSEPVLPSKPAGRAGRNLPVAIVVGLGLGAVVTVPLYTVRWLFVGVVVAAICVGLGELVQAVRVIGARPPAVPLVGGTAALLVATYLRGTEALVVGVSLTILGCLVWRAFGPATGLLTDIAATTFAAAYVPLMAGCCILLTVPPDGPRRVTAFIATVVCSDVGGYAAGALFGRHPLAPTVSPKKSWEGLVGSAVACSIAGVCFLALLLAGRWWQGVLYGLAVVATATIGDLGESMIKRDIGIKDMGRLLPGHGGLMDRLDSLLLTAPVAWLLLTAFVPPAR